MTAKTLTLLTHGLCVLAIAACTAIAAFAPIDPAASTTLIGAAAWLYGKLMFKPIAPVVDAIVARMEPERIERIKTQAPPPPDAEQPQ
jgi:hypothetical protein